MKSTVTAVVATFNQPEKLRVALRSIELQTHPVDETLVIGDFCSDETRQTIRDSSIPNLRYINLPVRCGEQAIPNAIGALFAKSEFVAYLNHDDLWFPSHVELGLGTLKKTRRPWFMGSAAFGGQEEKILDETVPIFGARTDPARSAAKSYSRDKGYLEPVSSWILQRDVLLSGGNWRPAWTQCRTPLAELALRLWRSSGEPATSSVLTVAKILGNRQKIPRSSPLYFEPPRIHQYLDALLDRVGQMWPDTFSWPASVSKVRGRQEKLHALFRSTYRVMGYDVVEGLKRFQGKPGDVLMTSLRRRTGEIGLGKYSVEEVAEMLEKRCL